ncbi:conserved hypothetical protein [Mucor ambiguus]|uniref:C2H2-type domain-containing protein n=1 Tax=Mucor ambiguus TaxID=91626 RepID=A0A0C9N2Y1_9FUNG|nr:conserved hypothetical protein [Mucor ambiguus]
MNASTPTTSSNTTTTTANNNATPTIATAPQVPSSTNLNYYDPRHSSNYYNPASGATPVQQSLYMNPTNLQNNHPNDMHSVSSVNAAAAAAAAAAAGLGPSNSLPPLSHLLPTNTSNNNSNNNATVAPIVADHAKNSELVTNITSNEEMGYFSPPDKHQNGANFVQPHHYSTSAPVLSHPHHVSYRKSIDYQRASMYPSSATSSADMSRRSFNQPPNGYYMMPTHNINSHYGHHPTAPNTIVPSTDLSVYPPHPSASLHHGMYPSAGRHHGQLYHLPSPPTSVIDGVLIADPNNHQHVINGGITNNSQKVFSFVPLPGLNQKKRPRRKFHEVERLYQCNFQDCTKSYGTLNHLNAHVSMQRHGPKRQPSEFKELRKMWRKQKRDNKQRTNSRSTTQSLEDNEQQDYEDEEQQQNHHHQDNINVSMQHTDNSILSHSMPMLSSSAPSSSSARHHQMMHHEYNPSMPPYMQHAPPPHPSLMSHPPPPPPPPPSAHWMSRSHPYHHAPEFMPHGY